MESTRSLMVTFAAVASLWSTAVAVEDSAERRELLALAAALAEEAPGGAARPGEAPLTTTVQTAPGLTVAPNPSFGAVAIRLELATPSTVNISVYDVLGRTVAVLADGPVEAGWATFQLDGAGLPAGMYVIRNTVAPEVGGATTLVSRLTIVR